MTITEKKLTQATGISAAVAGLLFIGIQINHPHLDVTSIVTTEVIIRNSLKVLMAVLALAGITGMYLSRVRRNGVLGLIGYLLLSVGYLSIMSTTLIAAYVLPAIADTSPGFVSNALAAATARTVTEDIGPLQTVFQVQGFAYLAGGLFLGVALFRAHVLSRWASALLAVGGLLTAVLSLMPDAFYRLLAFPTGIALIGLGYSLYRVASATRSPEPMVAVDATV
ncbi:MAG TPA: hypothetical protein VIH10_06825 [Kribbella sp.]|jgi:hypothetical protein